MCAESQSEEKQKRQLYYDRRVQRHGYTRTVALGRIIPDDWSYVRIYPVKVTDAEVHLVIRKLLGVQINASNHGINKERGEDT